jgi:hypothetical protein
MRYLQHSEKYLLIALLLVFVPRYVVAQPPTDEPMGRNLLRNGDFAYNLGAWQPWQHARTHSNWISVVTLTGRAGPYYAARIINPNAQLVGLQQPVTLISGRIYRLSAAVRSTMTNDSSRLFGGRVALHLPPQPERQLVWTTEYNDWWKRTLLITNRVTGTAMVFVHMGYGSVASTGEFTDIRLEVQQ